MGRLYTLLFSLLLVSCSVKKNVIKSELSTKTETEITKSDLEIVNTYTTSDTDTYEVEVVSKDSLQPITVTLGGVTQTFSGASKVVLRKKKESVKQQENKSIESKEVLSQEVVEEKKDLNKDVKRSNYSWLVIVAILFVIAVLVFGYLRKLRIL